MEFSEYVIGVLSSMKQVNRHRNYELAVQMKDAAAKALSQQDKDILETIGGVMSMSYVIKEHKFSPLLILNDGSRSFSFDDLKEEDVEVVEKATAVVQDIHIRTKLLHIAWELTKKYQYGEAAARGYVTLFEQSFDPEHWVDCHDAIQCAFHIASSLGKKSEIMRQTREAIKKKLIAMDGADPLFLSTALLTLVVKDASQKDLEIYYQLITKLAGKNICVENQNTHLADETFLVQGLILRRLKKEEAIKAATTAYAAYYEATAEVLAQRNDFFRAVFMLKKACSIHDSHDREKLRILRLRLEELQRKAMDNMQAIPFEYDAGPVHKKIDQLFNGLSLQETIVQMGCIARIYDVEETRKALYKEQDEFLFSSMLGSSVLNSQGQTVNELPPLRNVREEEKPDLLHKHLVHHVAKHRDIENSVTIGYAFGYIKGFGEFSIENLDFLLSENAIVPEEREEIIREGLYCGLTGKLYMAMHILLPQTENIFRRLVKMCGDTTTFLKEDGTESFKPLSALFSSDKLKECYDENIIFTFQSVMDEPIGENLRNLNAHGALDPKTGNGITALYFLCLLIRLLVMYSPQAQPVLRKLSQRDLEERNR